MRRQHSPDDPRIAWAVIEEVRAAGISRETLYQYLRAAE